MSEDILISHNEGILELQMNRPEARNAVSGELSNELQSAIRQHAYREESRCLVLSSSSKVFSVGGDVKGFAQNNDANDKAPSGKLYGLGEEAWMQTLRRLIDVSIMLYELPKPTIASIPGAAAGGGLSLALACDYRIAAKSAKITTAFANMGVSGDYGCAYFLSRIVGPDKAKDILFSSKTIPTEEALELGILTDVVADDDLQDAVNSKAAELAAGPTVAYGYMKKNVQAALELPLSQYLDIETERMTRTFKTNDHKRAVKAFVNKERPIFEGN